MSHAKNNTAFHYAADATGASYGLVDAGALQIANFHRVNIFSYDFQNFFHPFVGELIAQLNTADIAGMLDPTFLNGLTQDKSWFWGD